VSMNMRNLLRKMDKKSFRPGNAAAMFFLNATNPETIKLMRTGMVDIGFKAQRLANDLLRGLAKKQTAKPPATLGAAPIKEQVIHFINKKMPSGLPKKTARALLDIEDSNYVPIIRNHDCGHRGGVLLPRLRLGALVQPGRSRDTSHALARRRANGVAARLSVLRLSATRLGSV
jgi:hypothetical protein